ncbi:uncharacterized protein PHALS_03383 [Plasmopara halstedii]|uniref:Uncharacterized protein n=1 Tax=Plasmopara halstedii TaxID=4781 RepID=A0A0P1A913_PLAHL|nr:uncharacterized protein PHALS_03383 [Plasmopara halstedii]CEG36719.1 hypothetical protein PHALS_03383 [Plasmopara halstedii]|eukprot:XP_024573088.1 hypothetical protein PHALS_03383 [Plasmopara halstedii]
MTTSEPSAVTSKKTELRIARLRDSCQRVGYVLVKKNRRKTQWHVYQNINSNATDKEAITWVFCILRAYHLCFCWNLLST